MFISAAEAVSQAETCEDLPRYVDLVLKIYNIFLLCRSGFEKRRKTTFLCRSGFEKSRDTTLSMVRV